MQVSLMHFLRVRGLDEIPSQTRSQSAWLKTDALFGVADLREWCAMLSIAFARRRCWERTSKKMTKMTEMTEMTEMTDMTECQNNNQDD